jgi:hypothetical protein
MPAHQAAVCTTLRPAIIAPNWATYETAVCSTKRSTQWGTDVPAVEATFVAAH